jgi:predicted PurR-regulated permease PerM
MGFARGCGQGVADTDPAKKKVEKPGERAATAENRRPPPDRPIFRGVRPVTLLVGVVTAVGALYLGRAFLMPVAVAGLLTFLLNPIVRYFERWLPRVVAVMIVVILSFSTLGVVGWVLATQAADLGADIPTYRDNLKRKIADIRGVSQGGVFEKVQTATKEVVEELRKEQPPAKSAEKPVPVVVKPQPTALWRLPAVLEALGHIGLVLVLVIFMLLERLQLRDRLIRVIGFGRIATTTKAMDEAAQRISRYLTMQTLINGVYGVGVALGALAIGLPYAFLWGFLAAVLRFIPYVGPWAAAVLVSVAGLAVFDEWLQPLLIVAIFIVLELFTNLVLETYFYSQSAGVSQVALLLAVAFWTWIWGAIGLALATPLTVCLLVMAKHVPDLEIVTVLLSDEPVLGPDRSYYQRLIARDENEAAQLIEEFRKAHPGGEVFDEVLVPALNHAQRDFRRGRIDEADLRFVEDATRTLLEELDPLPGPAPAPAGPPPREEATVLALPARNEADEIALLMLAHVPDRGQWSLEIASPDLLASEIIDLVEEREPGVVLIGALAGLGDAVHLRYLTKRIHARFPDLPIVLGWWGAEADATTRTGLLEAGADRLGVTIRETCVQLQELVRLERPAAPAPLPARAGRPASAA